MLLACPNKEDIVHYIFISSHYKALRSNYYTWDGYLATAKQFPTRMP